MDGDKPYHEHVLHWLWQNRFLKNQDLYTCEGKKVMIHQPGYYNKTDGPDFTNARITIGHLKWHGDIEIHWHANDWKKHNHQNDPAFNRVVLHVIYEKLASDEVVSRYDQTSIPTLCLKPFLEKPLQYFFHHYQQRSVIPCKGNLASVPEDVIKQQFNEAHRSYLEQKVDDFLQFYDASLPLSQSWKQALIIAIFDNLGVSYNREPMKKLAHILLEESTRNNAVELIEYALSMAGIQPKENKPGFSWKKKGSRPANQPNNRIKQGCYMMHFIRQKEFSWWLQTELDESFSQTVSQINTTPGLGKQQSGIILGTVWIPAYYLLGDLTGNKTITSNATNQWAGHRTKLPNSIRNRFLQTDMPTTAFAKKLGAVHQYRSFCQPGQCQHCKIFQHIISS